MERNRQMNIEATILSSFLDADYYDDEHKEVFKLDPEVFSSEGFTFVAQQINRFIDAGKPMSLLYKKLDQVMEGTAYEFDYFFMLGRMHLRMSMVRKYYDDLVISHRRSIMKGI